MRHIERTLLFYCFLFILLGGLLHTLTSVGSTRQFLIGSLVLILAVAAVNLLLTFTRHDGDQIIFPLVVMLSVIGLVFIAHLKPELLVRQFYWLLSGLLVLVVVLLGIRDLSKFSNYKYLTMIIGILLLILPILFGKEIGGAKSWLDFKLFRFQPSEFAKILMVLFLADYLMENREVFRFGTKKIGWLFVPEGKFVLPLLTMWFLSLLLLVFQKDLGTGLIFFAGFLTMIFIATARWDFVLIGMVLFALGGVAAYWIFDHVKLRVELWLNPWPLADKAGYQIIQSLFAISAGGLFGSGVGSGAAHLIPAVHTDFIFSALIEEMGLFGGVLVVILYLLLMYRGFKIAMETNDEFGKLLASGLTALITIQSLVIMAGVTKLLPLTGITLPFISYGGSSMLANYLIVGLLLNISHTGRSGRSAGQLEQAGERNRAEYESQYESQY